MSWGRAVCLGALIGGLGWCATEAAGSLQAKFDYQMEGGSIVLRAPSEKPILRYVYSAPRPGEPGPAVEGAGYTHPLYTPSGVQVTDLAPADHPHHRGVFCAWVQVEGEAVGDWWGWGAKAPKEGRALQPAGRASLTAAAEMAMLRFQNRWMAEQVPVLAEDLQVRTATVEGNYVVDYTYRFSAPTRKPVTFVANPFGGFCYRARPRGEQTITNAAGEAVKLPDSVHNRAETNWPASPWYDMTYRMPDGKVNGVALMDHPENPKSTWHVVRGIHMLNPCIVAGNDVTIRPEQPLVLRYRLVVHDGEAETIRLKGLYEEFARAE